MELLKSDEIHPFCIGLKQRIYADRQYDLLPVYGGLCWLGKLCFARIYVDHKDPSLVTKIAVKMKKIEMSDVEAKMAEGVDGISILESWKKTMDEDKRDVNNYILFLWADATNDDLSSLECLVKGDHCFRIMEYELSNRFCQQFPFFVPNKRTNCYMCVLHSLQYFPFPEGYVLKMLTVDDAKYVMSSYKYAKDEMEVMLLCAANGFGIGAYHVETDKLVSSVFLHWDGSLSALQTDKGHQKKGLAKAIVSNLSQSLIRQGLPVYCVIEKDIETTVVSENLFSRLGFKSETNIVQSWLWCE